MVGGHLADGAAGEADQHHPALEGHAPAGPAERVPADHVEDDVGAAPPVAARTRATGSGSSARSMTRSGAHPPAGRPALAGPGDGGDDGGSPRPRPSWTAAEPTPPAAPVTSSGLPGPQPGPVVQGDVGGLVRDMQRRGGRHRHRLGHRVQLGAGHGDRLLQRPVRQLRHHHDVLARRDRRAVPGLGDHARRPRTRARTAAAAAPGTGPRRAADPGSSGPPRRSRPAPHRAPGSGPATRSRPEGVAGRAELAHPPRPRAGSGAAGGLDRPPLPAGRGHTGHLPIVGTERPR